MQLLLPRRQPPDTRVLAELLLTCDSILDATRAAIRLASIRSTTARLYASGTGYVLELDHKRALVFDPERGSVAIYADVSAALEDVPELELRSVQPPLAARQAETDELERRLRPGDRELLVLLMRGYTNGQIAFRLKLAESTIKNRLTQIYMRFGAHSRAEMILTATTLGLLPDADTLLAAS